VRTVVPLTGKRLVISFAAFGIVVQFGPRHTSIDGKTIARRTSLAGAQSLHAVRWLLGGVGGRVPVPEVYAEESFLYMELVQGITLLECWADLSDQATIDVCAQLKPMLEALQELEQDPSDLFIGEYGSSHTSSIELMACRDNWPPACAGPVVRGAWVSGAIHIRRSFPRLLRRSSEHIVVSQCLPQRADQPIHFTHGDINRANIIISPCSHSSDHRLATGAIVPS